MNNTGKSTRTNEAACSRTIMAGGTISTMGAFAEAVRDAAAAACGDGCDVSIQTVAKNNGTHSTGLMIHGKDTNTAPVIYLESLFGAYRNGMTVEAACGEVMRIYERNRAARDFDAATVTDFRTAREMVCHRLVNAGRNRDMLADIPHIPYHDLAVVFYIPVSVGTGGTGTISVRNSLLDAWGADTRVLYHAAMENTPRIFRGSVQPMGSILAELMEDAGECFGMAAATEDAFPAYVATNGSRTNGASVILYPGLLGDFAERIGSDFYILPSSIHEVILLPDAAGLDLEYMKMTVREINGSEVAPDEILSDSVYFYGRKHGRVEIV